MQAKKFSGNKYSITAVVDKLIYRFPSGKRAELKVAEPAKDGDVVEVNSGTSSSSDVEWDAVKHKPETFTPSTHVHNFEDIGEKPLAYPPSAHTHDYAATDHNHDTAYEAKNINIQAHVSSAHAPSNAQKNSDITKEEIEAKVTILSWNKIMLYNIQ